MFFKKRNNNGGDGLLEALARPSSRSIRLFGELMDMGSQQRRPLLVTTPTGVRPAALAAGDLAAAAADAGVSRLRLLDLRREMPASVHPLARSVDIQRPTPDLLDDSDALRRWAGGLVATAGHGIVLCAGVLDPRHWTEDPASWAFLEPLVVLAVAEGKHTDAEVAEAGERLRRRGMQIVGGVLVRTAGESLLPAGDAAAAAAALLRGGARLNTAKAAS